MNPDFSTNDDGLFGANPAPRAAATVISVGELNRRVSTLLERSFPLVWVGGEISNLTRAASGHWYFSLKDRDAQARCVMFRGRNQGLDWSPRDGDRVEARCLVGLYAPRGDFQLNVEQLRRAGAGSLYEAFLRLKEKLAAEGLFEPQRKRALPAFPRAIGIVTSTQAAALRDVLSTLRRRAPQVRIVLYPAPVQGADAPARLVAAVNAASRRAAASGEIDVLLLVRGGGSIEDLWAFNDEALARAIAACAVPVISGVGHETDFTIADFVADLRAPTPTGAAELASPDRERLLTEVNLRAQRMARAMQRGTRLAEQRLDDVLRRLKSPAQRWRDARERLAGSARRLDAAVLRRLDDGKRRVELTAMRLTRARPEVARHAQSVAGMADKLRRAEQSLLQRQGARLDLLAARLVLLDPANALARGYAIAADAQGRIVRDAADLAPGMRLHLSFARGAADADVTRIHVDDRTDAQPGPDA